MQVEDPDGVLVLHQTRVDAEGRLALARLDSRFREQWSSVLPFRELRNRWEWTDRLLMIGELDLAQRGVSAWHDFVVAVNLRDGHTPAWNVALERGVEPP